MSFHSLQTYMYTHTLVPASIAVDMVEVSASTNPLAVNLTVSYVSGDSIAHTYPYMHINRVSPCMQGKAGCMKSSPSFDNLFPGRCYFTTIMCYTRELQCIRLLYTLEVVHVIEVHILAIEL